MTCAWWLRIIFSMSRSCWSACGGPWMNNCGRRGEWRRGFIRGRKARGRGDRMGTRRLGMRRGWGGGRRVGAATGWAREGWGCDVARAGERAGVSGDPEEDDWKESESTDLWVGAAE